MFRVTHPFHPLVGVEFELLAHRYDTDQDRVVFRDEQGRLGRIPASWTSVVGPDPHFVVGEGRCRFRVEDLLALVQVIERLGSAPAHSANTRKGGV